MHSTLNRNALAALITALSCLGCGDDAAEEFPPPGVMQVISVKPVPVREEPNLIQNGNFSVWWAGAPVGEGFGAPNPAFSTIQREWSGHQWLAKQTWNKPDAAEAAPTRFHAPVNGIIPGSWYRLRVTTLGEVNASIVVSVAQKQQTNFIEIHPALITIMPTKDSGLVKHYSADFQAGDASTLYIATSFDAPAEERAAVTWQSWSLYRIEAPDS